MMMRLLLTLALILPAVLSVRVEVPYWTDDAGYCKPIVRDGLTLESGMHRPNGLEPISLVVGDSLLFKYSTHHDVWLHDTEQSLSTCDYSTAQMIADKIQGGGCTNEANSTCMEQATGFEWRASAAGTYHFSCSVGDHCTNGQRLTVTVNPAEALLPPHPTEVVVPYWTDDAGYCKPIPGFEHHVHRPSGLTPITLLQGQKLVFKYSIHHDVWAHPSREALEACDYTSAILLAGRMDGGGCEDDADLGCIESSKGFKLAPTQDELYLSCSIHDHCRNGQRLVVRMLPVSIDENSSTYAVPFAALLGAGVVAAVLIASVVALILCACRKQTPILRSMPNTAQHMSSSSEQTAHGV